MAYNFLGLVNDMCNRVNETELTSATFGTAVGIYSNFKSAVNASLNHINIQEFEWPTNHVTYDETLVPGTSRYSYQSDAKSVDFDTFRIQQDDTLGNDTMHLDFIDYDEYVQRLVDAEYETSTSIRELPRYVSRAPNNKYVVYPVPDKAYTLTYEYYTAPQELEAFDDVPSLPAIFKTTIVDGAMYYHYFFRGDTESADRFFQKFSAGIDNLRKIYINIGYEYVRDTRVQQRTPFGQTVLRVR